MAKLFRLPKFIQMEIGKALISNASEEFEKEEFIVMNPAKLYLIEYNLAIKQKIIPSLI